MVVKAKIGRKRYIIFKIDADLDISKRDLIYTFNKLLHERSNTTASETSFKLRAPPGAKINTTSANNTITFKQLPWIIKIINNYGIIRCHHLDKKRTIELLHSIKCTGNNKHPVKIRTLVTTGTIKKARKKYLDKLILYPLTNSKKK
jgi:RNase P/RNase MRP subunit POP5